jgi:hypothetical protein
MPPTDLPDLADPAFAGIKSRLARAYMDHKAILRRVDDITALPLRGVALAVATEKRAFMQRHAWFVDICTDLMGDVPAKPLDG